MVDSDAIRILGSPTKMETNTAQQSTQNLLQRTNIRTMKKDLKALREAEVSRESKRITKMSGQNDPPPQSALKSQPKSPVPRKLEIKETDKAKNIISTEIKEDIALAQENKKYALEPEKQEIFLLESERKTLLENLQEFSKKDSYLIRQKETALKKQADLQVQTAKTKIESEMGKESWQIENDLTKVNNEMQGIEKSIQLYEQQKVEIKNKISKINTSLNGIYRKIKERQNTKKEIEEGLAKEAEKIPAPTKKISADLDEKKRLQPKVKQANQSQNLKKESFGQIGKLDNLSEAQKEQKIKFMEEVEKWATSFNKNE